MPDIVYNYPLVKLSILDSGGGVAYQQEGTPAALRSRPAPNDIVVVTESAPADASGQGVNMTAMQKRRPKEQNYFFDKGDIIRLVISGQEYKPELTVPKYTPDYIDVLIEGVLLW